MTQPVITLKAHTLHVDGAPALIQAGALPYFRLPHPGLWPPALARLRMAGFNAVEIPFPWAYHSPAAGLYDFTGPRDLRALLNAAEHAGLWLIAAIGPWIAAGLDAGGIPPWSRQQSDFLPRCGSDVPAGPSFAFLRAVREWWERLFPFLVKRPNLLLLLLDPGPCADGEPLTRFVAPLRDLARELGGCAPCLAPAETSDDHPDGEWLWLDDGDTATWRENPTHPATFLHIQLTAPAATHPRGQSPQSPAHARQAMADVLSQGTRAYALAPLQAGLRGSSGETPGANGSSGALLTAGGALSEHYFQTRSLALATETLARALATSAPAQMVYASDARYLRGARAASAATVAFLSAQDGGEVRLSIPLGDEMLTTGPIPLWEDAVRVLPLNWWLAGGLLLTTTLEPVLHTVVAGRHLLVLTNAAGGEVLLSGDFRPRHARGPVRTQRTAAGLVVHFEAGRVVSLLVDGPEGPLQLLALAPGLAARVWPLDDHWRTTPAFPAAWHPAPEEPARGLLIGPDFVQPGADGGCDYLVAQKGGGYRWGPWRGSDPHTWLSPVSWTDPRAVTLPPLVWDAPRPGAPEVAPDYRADALPGAAPWRYVAHRAPLAMTAHGIESGFAWYRGQFKGAAGAVTLRCPHPCDVFFNGAHVAALNSVDDAPKTLPLLARLLRDDNLLAILVEGNAAHATWDAANAPRGLLACELDSGLPLLWNIRGGLSGERSVQGFAGYADWALLPDEDMLPETQSNVYAITWHRASFELALPDATDCPIFLHLEQAPAKVTLYLNGQRVGQYEEAHPAQRRFWLPEGILHQRGTNELLVAQWTRGANPGLGVARLEAGTGMQWNKL